MRDRKYKAWLKTEDRYGGHQFYDVEGWNEEGYVSLYGFGDAKWDDVVILESTGVKDSEGNDIYEGDVLHRDSHWLMYVEYVNGSYCLVAVDSVQRMSWIPIEISSYMISKIMHRRIVGNIVSNPEILDTNGNIVYELFKEGEIT